MKPFAAGIFTRKQELGKRNDDLRLDTGDGSVSGPTFWLGSTRFRRRRIFPALIAVALLYLFFRNIPTDLPPASRRYDSRLAFGPPSKNRGQTLPPQGRPPYDNDEPTGSSLHYFSGPIKFYSLAATLHGIAKTMGHRPINKNVLFAAASLKSASLLIPVACEMARWRRNYVHFVFMGRDEIPLEDVMELNGVGPECDVFWHDGRPDFSPYSSDFRMEVSVSAGLNHVDAFMHPQVVITDDSGEEEAYFTKAMRETTGNLHKPIIELPRDAAENLMWLTRLDSGSLSAWHRIEVDVVVHAPPESSGSLIRLLRSLQRADYFNSRPPRLAIELPSKVDHPVLDYLQHMVWPPSQSGNQAPVNQVTLRHRIPRHSVSIEETSTHFIESFYPVNPSDSHVLLLSPQIEISPLYYHYIKYMLLEYKYSSSGFQDITNLMGISLQTPSSYLNNSKSFSPPLTKPSAIKSGNSVESVGTPFLWQAPDGIAALYFGERWVEFHDFLSNRLELYHASAKGEQRARTRTRLTSENLPPWMEFCLELMRARGYSMLYPALNSADALVTMHNELFIRPVELPAIQDLEQGRIIDAKEPFSADPTFKTTFPKLSEKPLMTQPLLSILPLEGDLPEIANLPLLAYDGERIATSEAETMSRSFATAFGNEIGGCSGRISRKSKPMSATDLFCVDDKNDEDIEMTETKTDVFEKADAFDTMISTTATLTNAALPAFTPDALETSKPR
ncbi:MAG: hypothetical protein M1827_002369 [Pycnora praestabilis]|nr:MAG: hypothetical protein M1827_002369 [Pycnora praestabilis]